MPDASKDLTDILAEALRSGSPGTLHIRGTSMLPTLSEGLRVGVRPARPQDIPVGRIAVFQKENLVVVHRLVWKVDRDGTVEYLFKGDNSTVLEKVRADQILGEVGDLPPEGTAHPADPGGVPRVRWDRAGLFYHTSYLLLTPFLRLARILTGRPLRLPRGRLRIFLRQCHARIESVLFGRRTPR